jgi:hypothetical protein
VSGGYDPTLPICELPGYMTDAPGVDRLFDNLMALVPGLVLDMANMVCWNTIEDFYVKSTYRREHIYWRMDPGVVTLNFDPYDQDWRVCRFLNLVGFNIKFEPPGRIRDLTSPPPDNTRNGEVLIALKPRSINTVLPYDVWTTYWETLLHGALYRLYMQPGKPYSDLKAMEISAKLWRSGIASARADIQVGHLRDGAQWSFPYFATGGHADGRW